MEIYKWIGPIPQGITKWTRKKDIQNINKKRIIRVNFGFYLSYVELKGDILVGEPNVKVFSAHLTTPGAVIGLYYDDTAKHFDWKEEWRFTFHERILDKINNSLY